MLHTCDNSRNMLEEEGTNSDSYILDTVWMNLMEVADHGQTGYLDSCYTKVWSGNHEIMDPTVFDFCYMPLYACSNVSSSTKLHDKYTSEGNSSQGSSPFFNDYLTSGFKMRGGSAASLSVISSTRVSDDSEEKDLDFGTDMLTHPEKERADVEHSLSFSPEKLTQDHSHSISSRMDLHFLHQSIT